MLDANKYRPDFPILRQQIHDRPLVYLDNAATSQKPTVVISAMEQFYREYNANIHRGLHTLSEKATDAYEQVRGKVARFLNAPSASEIVFTRGTTEAINLVAYSWVRNNVKAGEAILITEMEHHSNIIPWQLLQKQCGYQLKYIPICEDGTLDLTTLPELLQNVKLVAVTHASNVLGTVNPIREIAAAAHARGALVLIDGAQGAAHLPVDVQQLDCDFYTLSAHKMCGPTGVGALWARTELLNSMEPFLGGGEMIHEVFLDHCSYADIPHKFEAGTMNIAQVIGMGVAIDYLQQIGMDEICAYEQYLARQAIAKLTAIEGVRVYGNAPHRGAAVSFTVAEVHPHDLSTILDQEGIAIRAGHHCAQPLLRKLGLHSTARASFYFYNLPEEIDVLVAGIEKAKEIFAYVT